MRGILKFCALCPFDPLRVVNKQCRQGRESNGIKVVESTTCESILVIREDFGDKGFKFLQIHTYVRVLLVHPT